MNGAARMKGLKGRKGPKGSLGAEGAAPSPFEPSAPSEAGAAVGAGVAEPAGGEGTPEVDPALAGGEAGQGAGAGEE